MPRMETNRRPRHAVWYFDVISPFAYLNLSRFAELPFDLSIEYKPILFAGLLHHWGQKGPAEIEPKRRWTYRACQYWADSHGVPFRFPAAHPFNPLHHQRLLVACGATQAAVRQVFEAIWTTGADPGDQSAFAALARSVGIDDLAALGTAEVKDALRRNTEAAVAAGVFGVPSFVSDGEIFWGNDSVDFFKAWLADPAILATPEMRRIDTLPVGAARRT
jgi:2-hydroxychromene-2-carboxylate isomerase